MSIIYGFGGAVLFGILGAIYPVHIPHLKGKHLMHISVEKRVEENFPKGFALGAFLGVLSGFVSALSEEYDLTAQAAAGFTGGLIVFWVFNYAFNSHFSPSTSRKYALLGGVIGLVLSLFIPPKSKLKIENKGKTKVSITPTAASPLETENRPLKCAKCDVNLNINDKFCPQCGNKVNSG